MEGIQNLNDIGDIKVDISQIFPQDKNVIDDNTQANNNNENDDEDNQGFFHKLHQKPIPLKSKTEVSKENENKLVSKHKRKRGKKKSFKNNYKKQICQFYINGACNKGDKCLYSHQAEQIHKKELCKFFLSGNCNKKDKCLYSHNLKEYPCKFFHVRGFCENFDQCRFSHERLNDEAIFPFIKENEQFLFEIRKKYGATNMDDFFNYYLKQKNALPDNVMIPDCIKNVDLNDANDNTGCNTFIPRNLQLSEREIMKMNKMMLMKMKAASNDNVLKDNTFNFNQTTISKTNNIAKCSNEDMHNDIKPKDNSTHSVLMINPFKHPNEIEGETLKDIISFIKGH